MSLTLNRNGDLDLCFQTRTNNSIYVSVTIIAQYLAYTCHILIQLSFLNLTPLVIYPNNLTTLHLLKSISYSMRSQSNHAEEMISADIYIYVFMCLIDMVHLLIDLDSPSSPLLD